MAWQREFYGSYTTVVKSRPIKVRANSKDEALDKFREMVKAGETEEEERNFQYNIVENLKQY